MRKRLRRSDRSLVCARHWLLLLAILVEVGCPSAEIHDAGGSAGSNLGREEDAGPAADTPLRDAGAPRSPPTSPEPDEPVWLNAWTIPEAPTGPGPLQICWESNYYSTCWVIARWPGAINTVDDWRGEPNTGCVDYDLEWPADIEVLCGLRANFELYFPYIYNFDVDPSSLPAEGGEAAVTWDAFDVDTCELVMTPESGESTLISTETSAEDVSAQVLSPSTFTLDCERNGIHVAATGNIPFACPEAPWPELGADPETGCPARYTTLDHERVWMFATPSLEGCVSEGIGAMEEYDWHNHGAGCSSRRFKVSPFDGKVFYMESDTVFQFLPEEGPFDAYCRGTDVVHPVADTSGCEENEALDYFISWEGEIFYMCWHDGLLNIRHPDGSLHETVAEPRALGPGDIILSRVPETGELLFELGGEVIPINTSPWGSVIARRMTDDGVLFALGESPTRLVKFDFEGQPTELATYPMPPELMTMGLAHWQRALAANGNLYWIGISHYVDGPAGVVKFQPGCGESVLVYSREDGALESYGGELFTGP